MPFLPETPRWLYSHGKEAEAVQVLARLMSCGEDDPKVRMIKSEMKAALEIETIKEHFLRPYGFEELSAAHPLFLDSNDATIHRHQCHCILWCVFFFPLKRAHFNCSK